MTALALPGSVLWFPSKRSLLPVPHIWVPNLAFMSGARGFDRGIARGVGVRETNQPAGGAAVDISNTANPAHVNNPGTSTDFTSVAIGDADANRVIAVPVSCGWNAKSGTIDSVTINAVSATQQVAVLGGSASGDHVRAEIWAAVVPTGTSVTINTGLSASSGNNRSLNIGVYRMLNTGGGIVADATNTDFDDAAGPLLDASVNTVTDGAVISCSIAQQSDATISWVGVTQNDLSDGISNEHSHGHGAVTTGETPRTVRSDWGGSANKSAMVAAAWNGT